MNKKKESTILWSRVGKAMQNYYRSLPAEKCLGMGKSCQYRANVRHHHFRWGNSTPLREEEINLVPLCTNCHCAFHNGDKTTKVNYEKAMKLKWGEGWEDELLTMDRIGERRKGKDLIEYLKEREKWYKENTTN